MAFKMAFKCGCLKMEPLPTSTKLAIKVTPHSAFATWWRSLGRDERCSSAEQKLRYAPKPQLSLNTAFAPFASFA